jgi:hypothetical protein
MPISRTESSYVCNHVSFLRYTLEHTHQNVFDCVGNLAVEILDLLIDIFGCEELPDMSFSVVIYPFLANGVKSAAMNNEDMSRKRGR